LFQWDGEGFARLIDEVSIKVNRMLEDIRLLSAGKIIFTGEGAVLYKDEIVNIMGEDAIFASIDKMIPAPSNVAAIAMKKALRGEFSEPVSLVPFYLRRSEAEIKRDD
jgi:tRNA threonylcarbamoyladenosine biosynthesis protein TsaB